MSESVQPTENRRSGLWRAVRSSALAASVLVAAYGEPVPPAPVTAEAPTYTIPLPEVHTEVVTPPTTVSGHSDEAPLPKPPVTIAEQPPLVSQVPDLPPTTSAELPPKQRLELPHITAEAAAVMATETVYFNSPRCSAFLVRSEGGTPVGMVTAEHCSLRGGANTKRGQDATGAPIIRLSTDQVSTGDSLDSLVPAGKLTEIIANPDNDTSGDLAFGIFAGHSAEEVVANYRHFSDEQLAQLPLGNTIYLSGWPINAGADALDSRQTFALSVLGTDTVTTENGETLQVLTAAMPRRQNQAECSFGDSGGEGFALDADGKPVSVGVLASFDELSPSLLDPSRSPTARAYYEYRYNVDLTGYDAVCSFAYKQPQLERGAVRLTVKTAEKEQQEQLERQKQQDQERYQQQVARLREQFFDPHTPRQIIDGLVKIPHGKGGGGPLEDTWVERPAILEDKDGLLWLATFNPKAEQGFAPIRTGVLLTSVWALEGDTDGKPSIVTDTGEVTIATDKQGLDQNAFVSDGLQFGHLVSPRPESTNVTYYLVGAADHTYSLAAAPEQPSQK